MVLSEHVCENFDMVFTWSLMWSIGLNLLKRLKRLLSFYAHLVLTLLKNKEKKDRGNQIKLLASYRHSTTSRPTEVKSI